MTIGYVGKSFAPSRRKAGLKSGVNRLANWVLKVGNITGVGEVSPVLKIRVLRVLRGQKLAAILFYFPTQ
jgi:hypothetical protein